MKKSYHYRLKISGTTPEELPMETLAIYMAKLAKLVGNAESVHFERVERGSAELHWAIERNAEPKVRRRLASVAKGTAANRDLRAFDELNDALAANNCSAKVQRKASAGRYSNVLAFPGVVVEEDIIGPIVQPGHLDGQVFLIGGRDQTVPVHIKDPQGREWACTATVAQAQELGRLLLGPVIRVYGTGSWERTSSGVWRLVRKGANRGFVISHFEKLDDWSIGDVVHRLQERRSSGWADERDPLGELRKLRHGNDENH